MAPRFQADYARFLLIGVAALVTVMHPAASFATPSSDLAKLADEYWQGSLEAYPTMATSVGARISGSGMQRSGG